MIRSYLPAVVFLALFQALKHLNKNYAALGATASFVSWVLGLPSRQRVGERLSWCT